MTFRARFLLPSLLAILICGDDSAVAAGERAPLLIKPKTTVVAEGRSDRIIEVKFRHDSAVRLRNGQLRGASADQVEAVNALVEAEGASLRRTFMQSEAWLESWHRQGESRSGLELHDLNLFFCVDLPEGAPAAAICDVLNSLDVVEIAWPAAIPSDPTIPAVTLCLAVMAPTPDFQNQQGYRGPAPTGVDADYGNTFSGGKGIGVTIIDCETGWTDDHEDLINKAQGRFVGYTPARYPWDHGTAVLGEIVGEDNGIGVLGLATDAEVYMSTHSPVGGTTNIPGSVMNAAAVATTGDVIVIEIQCYGTPPGPFPCEYDPTMFATVQAATANGVHVIAAAGNGNNDLDQPAYGGAFDLNVRDSGAIMVGASDGSSLNKASFSNYGTRCSSHGWGFNVTTTGYGALWNDPADPDRREYTDGFSGTSSATPIVTGAATALISMHRESFKSEIDPIDLRTLLEATGTPQGSGGQIGTRPDLRTAIRSLGIPEVQVSGNLVPGGQVDVTNHGTSGDLYALFWSADLAANPLHLAKAGYLFLEPVGLQIAAIGSIGASGQANLSFGIPNDGGLSGFESHFQSVQQFNSGPGDSSFSNYATWEIQ